jgi:hypothetical protein
MIISRPVQTLDGLERGSGSPVVEIGPQVLDDGS